MRLNIAAGTSVRFEPGEKKSVFLVEIGGNKIIRGGNNLCNGPVSTDPAVVDDLIQSLQSKGFLHTSEGEDDGNEAAAKKRRVDGFSQVDRAMYVRMYGPTVGDVVRLADTDLFVRVEKDHTVYGDECKFGGGKVHQFYAF